MKVAAISIASLLSIFSLAAPANAQNLNSLLKRTSFVVLGPSGDGTGFAIGQKNGFIYFLTAAHVVGKSNNESEVMTSPDEYQSVEVIKRFAGKDIALARFPYSGSGILPLAINSFLPYPSPNTAESGGVINLRSSVDTVTTKAIVSGFSLPTAAIKIRVHRVIDAEVVDQIQGNIDGYDLLYQASTIPGMSGGPVVGFRDCSNTGGFALGISPNSVFPVLLAVHGRSEGYGDQGRSGISLGVPIVDDIQDHLDSKSDEYGIKIGEKEIRSYVDNSFCINARLSPDELKRMRNYQNNQNTMPKLSF